MSDEKYDGTNEQLKVLQITELRRIADSLEEVIKMVKADQEKTAERYRKYDNEEDMLDDLSKPWKEDKPKNDLPDNINGRPYKGRL